MSISSTKPLQQHSLQPPFKTYLEYLEHAFPYPIDYCADYKSLVNHLSARPQGNNPPPICNEHEALWIMRFYSDGRPSASYLFKGVIYVQDPSYIPADYTYLASSLEAQKVLNNFEEAASYQVVVLTLGYRELPPVWAINVLGLGLDMEPGVWAYLCAHDPKVSDHRKSVWVNRNNFIEVGGHLMVILEALPGQCPKTGIIFIRLGSPQLEDVQSESRLLNMYPLNIPSAARIAQKRPQIVPRDSFPPPWLYKNYKGLNGAKHVVLRRWITTESLKPEKYGPGNFLFSCLEGLVRMQIAVAPSFVATFDPRYGLFTSRYYLFRTSPMGPIVDARVLWHGLRNDVDEGRLTLHRLPAFLEGSFDTGQSAFKNQVDRVITLYEHHIRELELAEERLKDEISIFSSGKSTEMAERSIAESKRVIIVTILAFIFLPVSLAASIYGMNVQQINGSGHSITSFVVTSIVVLAVTLILWGTTTRFLRHREYRHARREERYRKMFDT